MGFDFGAFAGGVASGYEAASKLRIEQQEQDNKRKKLLADMKQKQTEALNEAKKGLADNELERTEAVIKFNKDLADVKTAEQDAALREAHKANMEAFGQQEQYYTEQLAELNPTPEQTADVAQAGATAVNQAVAAETEVTKTFGSIRFDGKEYSGNAQATNFLKMRMKAPNAQETTRVNENSYEIETKDKDGKWQSAGFEPLRYFAPEVKDDRSTELERATKEHNKKYGTELTVSEFKNKFWSPKQGGQDVKVETLPSKVQQAVRNQLGADVKTIPQAVANTYMTEDTAETAPKEYSIVGSEEKKNLGIPSHAIVQKESTTGKLTISNLKTNEQVKIPEGMNPIYDNTGKIVEFVPIKGSKAYIEAESAKEKTALKQEATVDAANIVIDKVDEALQVVEDEWFATGLAAQATGWIGGTSGLELQSKYDTINAIMGFEELSKMRSQSQTGGALGNVTEMEIKLLQSTTAQLNKDLKADVQKGHLAQVKRKYLRIMVKAGFYDNASEFGYAPTRPFYGDDGKISGWKVAGRLIDDGEMRKVLTNKEYNKLRAVTGKKKQKSPFFK